MSNRLDLVVLYGGRSGEHEISLRSAASVLAHLDAERYRILPVGIDKDGRFFLNDYDELLRHRDALPVVTEQSRQLPHLLNDTGLVIHADVVFPVVHGPLYEDGCLQGMLKLANVAYVGCDVLSSALGMDKDIARRVACVDGVQSARYRVLSWHANEEELQQFCQQTIQALGWPLFVKPCSMGSSVGIHKVKNEMELLNAIRDARRYDETIIVEEYIQGREIELAVLENIVPNHKPRVTMAGEITVGHIDGFYSYTAKYIDSDQTGLTIPAKLDPVVLHELQRQAADIFVALKCKGLARVDFFVNDETGQIYFNEINTLPGFTSISMYPKLWADCGMSYSTLLDQLIELARIHHRCRTQLVTHYQ